MFPNAIIHICYFHTIQAVYKKLNKQQEILYDDRQDVSAGQKLTEADPLYSSSNKLFIFADAEKLS